MLARRTVRRRISREREDCDLNVERNSFPFRPCRSTRAWFARDEGPPTSGVGPTRLETWNCPDHELVEQRDREGHVSVCRAVDHSFLDQLGAHDPKLVTLTFSASAMSPVR